MLWQVIALASFLVLPSISQLSCYDSDGIATICGSSGTYCEITDSIDVDWEGKNYTFDNSTEKSCTDGEDDNSASYTCELFDNANKCSTITVTDTNYDYSCDGYTDESVTYTERTYCCSTNLCNNDFPNSCTPNADMQEASDNMYECLNDYQTSNYDFYKAVACSENPTTTPNMCDKTYSTSVADLFGCQCGTFHTVYEGAPSDIQAEFKSDIDELFTSGLNIIPGCHFAFTCDVSTGDYTAVISTHYVTLNLAVMGVDQSDYNAIVMSSAIQSGINNNADNIDYVDNVLQVIVTSTTFLSDSNATLTTDIQFPDQGNATYFKNALDAGKIAVASDDYPYTFNLTSSSAVMEKTFVDVDGSNFGLFGVSIQFTFYGVVFIAMMITNNF